MNSSFRKGIRGSGLVAAIMFALGGCATTHPMMPTPLLYTGSNAKPLFTDLSAAQQKAPLDLLFITDRAPEGTPDGDSSYGAGRAHSIAFGSTTVEFSGEVTSESSVTNSTSPERHTSVELKLGTTKELGRFPRIPYEVARTDDGFVRLPAIVDAHVEARKKLQAEIARRLAIAHRKDVVLYVHGYHNSFEDAVLTMGELCHFLGREFVCGIFTWPAGGTRGVLFGYDVDRESSEFAVEDLLKTIRIVAATQDLRKIHLIAHSRGTDTLATALAELSAEAYILRKSLARQFKIGNVVLAAPDIDADVALSKIFKVFSDPDLPFGVTSDVNAVLEPTPSFKVTIYVSPDDKALATSGWLFGSIARLGRIDATMLNPHQIDEIGVLGAVDVIQVRGKTDFFGHSYFASNPHVSSDIIAMLRYGLKPNEPGRPLEPVVPPFWRIPMER